MEACWPVSVVPDVQNHSLAALARAAGGAGSRRLVSFGGFGDIDAVARRVYGPAPRVRAVDAGDGGRARVGDADRGAAAARLLAASSSRADTSRR